MKDIADAILALPGVIKATAKLVGASASAGAAWIDIATAQAERKSADIRGITDARTEVRKAMTKSIVEQIQTEGGLGQRALEHFANEILETQINREEVTRLAIGYLTDDPPSSNPSSEPTNDWLNVFSSYAERATDERIREHWAAILAGEIRKPGRISLLTLRMMATLDQHNAEIISKYTNYVMKNGQDHFVPLFGVFNMDPIYKDLLALDAFGFLSVGSHVVESKEFEYGNYILKSSDDNNAHLHAAVLTQAGTELFDILGQKVTLDEIKFVIKEASTIGYSLDTYKADTQEKFDLSD